VPVTASSTAGGLARLARPVPIGVLIAGLVMAAMRVVAPYAGDNSSPLPLVLLFSAAGLSFVVVGQVASAKRPDSRVGLLMTVTGFLYLLPNVVPVDSSWTWAFSRVTSWLYLPVLAHLFLSFPGGRLRSDPARALATTLYVFTTVGALVSTPLFYRKKVECANCPSSNPLQIYSSSELSVAVDTALQAIGGVLAVLVITTVAIYWRRASRPERRPLTPLVWATGFNAVVFTVLAVVEAADPNRGLSPALKALQPAALLLMPVGFLSGLLRSRLARVAVGDLVLELGSSADLAELRAAIARALGDPSLELVRWNERADGFIDDTGRLVELPVSGSRAVTRIDGDEGAVAALVHDPSLLEERQLVNAVSAAARLALENRRLREEIKLSREIPSGLAERLLREGRRIGETEVLDVTVLMSDFRGYTTIAERADPQLLAGQLDEHRKEMSRVIAEWGGTVMQFIGDAVFAVFGAPLPKDDHAECAVAATRAMHAAQVAVNARWVDRGLPRFEMGIGLSTGTVAAALLGSDEHLEYTVVGDTVNLVQRLQQWAERGETVISEPTYTAVGGAPEAVSIEPATVKGREALVVAYRLRSRLTPLQ
jgi:class 3 adenylate cyclase